MSEFEPGRAVRVAAAVHRLVAPNASMMTGPGTNTYLLGEPPTAVIDPGPADESHVRAILDAAPALAQIFVTHTHVDHSPAVCVLAERTGARRIGRPPPAEGRHDGTFVPDVHPTRDQIFAVGALALRAIDTPGHASNHVCYLLEDEGLLFSGDHLLDGVTPVIIPPDGEMSAYLESLERLKTYPLRAIAPGHGRVLPDPYAIIDGVIAHRLARERKVAAALAAAQRATLDELLPRVYDDVNPQLHGYARMSLHAHLIKLAREGRCAREADVWLHVH